MFSRISFFCILVFAIALTESSAQISNSSSNGADASKATSRERGGGDDAPSQNMLETRERWRMETEEKDHRELLDRTEKAARLSAEINQSFSSNKAFLSGDAAKLLELEKLIKKIRKNLGGDDDKDATAEAEPATISDALAKLSETGANLSEEIKKISRHEVSADSIAKSNEMLDLIILIRSFAQSAQQK